MSTTPDNRALRARAGAGHRVGVDHDDDGNG